jgi:predicted nucleic acid-binding protein
MAAVVVDSGPLIALFDAGDEHHACAREWIQHFSDRLVSNVAVATEVMYVLDFDQRAQLDFLRWISRGGLALADVTPADCDRCAEIMQKYADLPADFADASLVALAERLQVREVASIDRDFDIYRLRDRIRLRNIFPRR